MTTHSTIDHIPTAMHLGDDELPWVTGFDENSRLKLPLSKVKEGLWIVRVQYQPGVLIELQPHKHTGPVYAFTASGSWGYRESEYMNTAGSFLYEPAGSVHTLFVPETNEEVTDVWFTIYGANLNLDPAGEIESVTDAASILEYYLERCEADGAGNPPVQTD